MSGLRSSFESSHRHHNHHQQQDSLKPRNSLPQMMKLTTTTTTTTTNHDHDHDHHNRPMTNNINPTTTTPRFYARLVGSATHHPSMYLSSSTHHRNDLHSFQTGGVVGDDHIIDEDIIHTTTVNIPQVTVVLEGRSICQRISLDKHASYRSLAKALRQMFVDVDATTGAIVGDHHRLSLINSTSGSSNKEEEEEQQLDLSNAIPGYVIAYEDMEDDLLLAGDLNWKDFVRVAKRIRIIPVKANSRKGRGGA